MVISATIMWAASMPLIKIALLEVPPITLAVLRFGIASIILFLFLLLIVGFNKIKSLDKSTWLMIIIWGIIDIVIPNILQNIGLMYTTASVGTLIQSSYPIFTILLGITILSESFGIKKAGGTILAVSSIYLLITGGGIDFSSATFFGNLLLFISAVSYGFADFLGKKTLLKEVNPMLIIGLGIPIGTLILLPLALIIENPITTLLTLPLNIWLVILLLALFPASLAYILYYYAMREIEVSKLVLFGYLIPVYAVIISYFVLGEVVGFLPLLFGAMIIIGIALAQLETKKPLLNKKYNKITNERG